MSLTFRVAGIVLVLGSTTLGLVSSAANAEPVEVRQGTYVGAGYSFRRGAMCFVITAGHVVPEIGVPVTVLDRTGAKAEGRRAYENASYDLALVELPDNPLVTCTTTWPDVAWMRGASSLARGEFRAIRHYPDGREVIIRLTYGGGRKDELSLAPVDKSTIRESDSGSMVELEGRLVGIVKSVSTDTDRVNVLRFDRIDELVGDRFRGASGSRAVSYAGVLRSGRQNPTWSTYVQAWMTEKAGLTVVPTAVSAKVMPRPACEVKVEVLSWDRVPVSNPEFDGLQLQLKACGKRGAIWEHICKQARAASATTPRQLPGQKIVLNVTVTPSGEASLTRLTSTTHVPESGKLSQSEIEFTSLQAAVSPTLTDLLSRGACN